MSSSSKANTQTSNKQSQSSDALRDTSQIATGDQPVDKSESLDTRPDKQSSSQPQKSKGQKFGQESWDEFSSRSKKTDSDEQSWRGRNQSRNMHDQGRPTHEWERRQEQEYSGQQFNRNPRSQEWNDRGYRRDREYDQGQPNQWGGQDDRGNYNRDRSGYVSDYNQSATQREDREYGSMRDLSEEYQRGGNRHSVERGRGLGERGERMPGGHGPSVSGRDYENHPGNRETAGQHRYGGRPERDYEQSRFQQQSVTWDRERDYSDRDYRQNDRQFGNRDQQDQRSQNATQRQPGRGDSEWSRDRQSEGYN